MRLKEITFSNKENTQISTSQLLIRQVVEILTQLLSLVIDQLHQFNPNMNKTIMSVNLSQSLRLKQGDNYSSVLEKFPTIYTAKIYVQHHN